MKTYKITEESLQAAKRVSYHNNFILYITAVLDALFVEVGEEAEGWVIATNDDTCYVKNGYRLQRNNYYWLLMKQGWVARINRTFSVPEAQALADAEIAKYEAAKKRVEAKNPKPFGPGTRLRAVNGDALKIIDGSQMFLDGVTRRYFVVNLTTNQIIKPGYRYYLWENLFELKKAMEDSGATVIEEE